MSLVFIGIVAILSIIYGLIAHGFFTLSYVFVANFLIGAVVIAAGIFAMFVPSSMLPKGDKLFDHTTYVQRSFNARQRRQKLSMEILMVGITNIVLAGLIEILVSMIT